MSISGDSIPEYVARKVWGTGAFEFFDGVEKPHPTLKNGSRSPMYLTAQRLLSPPYRENLMKAAVTVARVGGFGNAEFVAGGELRGIPFAEQYAPHGPQGSDQRGIWTVMVRKSEKKGHGDPRKVVPVGITPGYEARIRRGEEVPKGFLFEDLVTDGGSKLGFLKSLEGFGRVEHCLVAIDRLQGGKETLREAGCALYSLTDIGHILNAGVRERAITEQQHRELETYLGDPKVWNEDHGYEWPKG